MPITVAAASLPAAGSAFGKAGAQNASSKAPRKRSTAAAYEAVEELTYSGGDGAGEGGKAKAASAGAARAKEERKLASAAALEAASRQARALAAKQREAEEAEEAEEAAAAERAAKRRRKLEQLQQEEEEAQATAAQRKAAASKKKAQAKPAAGAGFDLGIDGVTSAASGATDAYAAAYLDFNGGDYGAGGSEYADADPASVDASPAGNLPPSLLRMYSGASCKLDADGDVDMEGGGGVAFGSAASSLGLDASQELSEGGPITAFQEMLAKVHGLIAAADVALQSFPADSMPMVTNAKARLGRELAAKAGTMAAPAQQEADAALKKLSATLGKVRAAASKASTAVKAHGDILMAAKSASAAAMNKAKEVMGAGNAAGGMGGLAHLKHLLDTAPADVEGSLAKLRQQLEAKAASEFAKRTAAASAANLSVQDMLARLFKKMSSAEIVI
jgi:hypothetical protein